MHSYFFILYCQKHYTTIRLTTLRNPKVSCVLMLFFHKSPLSASCEKMIYLSDDNLSFIIIAATPYRFWQPSHPERNSSRKWTRNTAAITAMVAYFVKRDMRGIAFVVKVWLFFFHWHQINTKERPYTFSPKLKENFKPEKGANQREVTKWTD